MVKVKFFNLLRSKYKIETEQVTSGTIYSIIKQILEKHPNMKEADFKTCIVFFNNKPYHWHGFHTDIADGEEIIITHFVGGG